MFFLQQNYNGIRETYEEGLIEMKLKQLLNALWIYRYEGNKDNIDIQSVEMDSRLVTKGSAFICIEGYNTDGHQYVKQAIRNGAVLIVAEKEVKSSVPVVYVSDTKRAMAVIANTFYHHPTQALNLIGVTGTNGKTTVTNMIHTIITNQKIKTGLIGTIEMKIGDKVFETKNTTPESLLLQKAFAKMVDEHVETAIMEVSSHALDLGRVRGCDFDIAVFTNLTQDHLDYHQTMEEYEKAKGLLFSQLGNTYGKKRKVAILNADDPVSKTYAKQTTAHILTYGIEHGADIQATNIKMDAKGTTFDVVTPFGNGFVTLKLIGQFNIYNALAAIATTLSYGIPLENILSSLEEMKGVSGRFEVVDEHTPYTVIVDYAHTPDSLLNVLQTTREIVSGRSIVVVGCGGDRDRTKRPKMAQIAVKEADVRIFTSDNPRTEDPVQILKDMESGVEGEDYTTIVNRKEAIFHAVNIAEEGDVIVIAGKGHEDYQIIGSDVIHFDDREVARDAIKEKENGNK